MTKFYPQQPGTKIKTPLSEFYLKDGTVLRARVPSLGEEDENIVGMLEDGRRFVVPMANINYTVDVEDVFYYAQIINEAYTYRSRGSAHNHH
jgi:hypothetical protein